MCYGSIQHIAVLELLRPVKAVQDFSAGCSTSIGPQIDVPFNK